MRASSAANAAAAGQAPDIFRGFREDDLRSEANAVFDEIERLGLVDHFAELEIKGMTVIPPEKAGLGDLLPRLREAVKKVDFARTGIRKDWEEEGKPDRAGKPFGDMLSYILLEDPAFQELLLNPTVLAFPTWQLGRNCIVNAIQCLIKGPGDGDLALHSDELVVPPPYPHHTSSFNVTIPLTDYTLEAGPIAYVPGSQRMFRQPHGKEAVEQITPVIAPAGSLICFGSRVWHAALPRRIKGLRVNLSLFFSRPHLRPAEDYRADAAAAGLLDRHPPRFKTLLGIPAKTWGAEGPTANGTISMLGRNAFS